MEDLRDFICTHIAALNRLCDNFTLGNAMKMKAADEALEQLVPGND